MRVGAALQRSQYLHRALLSGARRATAEGFHGARHQHHRLSAWRPYHSIKLAEVTQALKDGGEELDAVVNISKVRSRDWQYVTRRVECAGRCHARGRRKDQSDLRKCLSRRRDKIRLCEICAEIGADWVKTSTGYAPGRSYPCRSGTDAQVLAAAGASKGGGRRARSGHGANIRAIGVSRVGMRSTAIILEEWRKRLGLEPISHGVPATAPDGY